MTGDLRKRFGGLVGAHRRRRGWTQERLAEAANVSIDMISKIEAGASGARFPVIMKLAQALDVDPAEFFTADLPSGKFRKGAYLELSTRLAELSDPDITWLKGIVEAALAPVRREAPAETSARRSTRGKSHGRS